MEPINPKEIRYIKLGQGGKWAEQAVKDGEIPFGYQGVPHKLCKAGEWERVADCIRAMGRTSKQAISRGVTEVKEFYTLGEECLWITIEFGCLWWAYARPEVKSCMGTEHSENGAPRWRTTINGWQNRDIEGNPLKIEGLSTRLTQLAAYRGTICRVAPAAYLLRRINGQPEPLAAKAASLREEMQRVVATMIRGLHWADFEVLVDLIFSRTGWRRTSGLGGDLKDIDLALENPSIGERAFVQVKSKANQQVLDDYVQRFRNNDSYDRMYFVCHSPQGISNSSYGANIHFWADEALADMAMQASLYDWLIEKSS